MRKFGGGTGESLGLGRGLLENSRGGTGESLGLGRGLWENSRGGTGESLGLGIEEIFWNTNYISIGK